MPPDVDEGDRRDGPRLAAEEGDLVDADPFEDLVDDADLVVERPEPDQRDDHVGDEVGQQEAPADQRGLGQPVHEHCETERDDRLEADVEDDVLQRHLHRVPEQVVLDDLAVVVQPDELRGTQQAVLGEAEIQPAQRRPQVEHREPDGGWGDEEQGHAEVAAAGTGLALLQVWDFSLRTGGVRWSPAGISTDSEVIECTHLPGETHARIFWTHGGARSDPVVVWALRTLSAFRHSADCCNGSKQARKPRRYASRVAMATLRTNLVSNPLLTKRHLRYLLV